MRLAYFGVRFFSPPRGLLRHVKGWLVLKIFDHTFISSILDGYHNNMSNPSIKMEHDITESAQLADSKDDGPLDRRHDTLRQPTTAEEAGPSSDVRHRRSLLPQRLAPRSSLRTNVLQKETQPMDMVVAESIPQTLSVTPNLSIKKTSIPMTASERNESPSGSKTQALPAKNPGRSFSARRKVNGITSRLCGR
jgi:hypothetical protein